MNSPASVVGKFYDHAGHAAASPRRVDRRVCGWRVIHAISLGHLVSTPLWFGLEPGRKLQPSPRLAFLVHDIHEQSNNTYAKVSGQTVDRRLVGTFARFARAVFGYRCMDHETKRAGTHPPRSHPPACGAGAEGEGEMTMIDPDEMLLLSAHERIRRSEKSMVLRARVWKEVRMLAFRWAGIFLVIGLSIALLRTVLPSA
jgi:hypothetical protein